MGAGPVKMSWTSSYGIGENSIVCDSHSRTLERLERSPRSSSTYHGATRELAVQVRGGVKNCLGRKVNVWPFTAAKPLKGQIDKLKRGPMLLWVLWSRFRSFESGSLNLGRLSFVVLDEADRCWISDFDPN